jgi:hypothetical protein
MKKPTMTLARWEFLKTISSHKKFQDESFMSCELADQVTVDFNKRGHNNPGATMFSLEKAGWVRRAKPNETKAFRLNTNGEAWELTDEGRYVLSILPTKAPSRYA